MTFITVDIDINSYNLRGGLYPFDLYVATEGHEKVASSNFRFIFKG